MANALGIDMGEVYSTVEAVKASRAKRGANEREAQNALATQEASRRYASGDESALADLVALNPDAAKKITEVYSSLDENERKKAKEQIEVLGNMAAGILASPDPAAAYQQALASMPPEARAKLPPEYDETFITYQLGRATEAAKIYESIDSRNVKAADREFEREKIGLQHQNSLAETVAKAEVEAASDERDRAHDFALEDSKAQNALALAERKGELKGTGGVDASDTNAIYRQSVELLGGIFDQAGNIQMLDPSLRAKAQQIATDASKLYAAGGLTHAEAVSQAAKNAGIRFPGGAGNAMVPQGDPADPLGLRGQ